MLPTTEFALLRRVATEQASGRAPSLSAAVVRNGELVWSAARGEVDGATPDNRTLYWANTPEHRIDRFDFDVTTGEITRRRPWVQFDRKVEGQPYGGRPDGAAVDVEGNYWVAMYEGACVLQLSPAGEVLQRIAVPVQCPTMVCFGGEDLRTLFITSARAGRPVEEQEAAVTAGSLFSAPVEVAGLPVNFFGG